MYYASLLDGWTDGLKSNLLAEFTGFVFGTIVTLFGVSRLLEAREHRRLAPLRARFAGRVETTLGLMSMGWAVGLSMTQRAGLPQDLHLGVLEAVSDLEKGLVETLRESIAQGRDSYVHVLAEEAIDLVHDISLAADRFPQVLAADIELAELVEDIEQKANEVRMVSKRESLSRTEEGEKALAAGCLEILRLTSELHARLTAAGKAAAA